MAQKVSVWPRKVLQNRSQTEEFHDFRSSNTVFYDTFWSKNHWKFKTGCSKPLCFTCFRLWKTAKIAPGPWGPATANKPKTRRKTLIRRYVDIFLFLRIFKIRRPRSGVLDPVSGGGFTLSQGRGLPLPYPSPRTPSPPDGQKHRKIRGVSNKSEFRTGAEGFFFGLFGTF